jgi:glucose-6-phosphate isomerase
MFIDGMSIVDKHCQETTIDQNICVYMALLRIWSSICNRKITTIITYDDELQYFSKIKILNLCKKILIYILGEYAQMLLTEFEHKMIGTYTSIHGISLAKIFLQQQNHISYDLIVIGEISQKINQQSDLSDLQTNKLSHPYTFILLDQLTPLTLGSIIEIKLK